MTFQQALEILTNATAQLNATRQMHMQIAQALEVIKKSDEKNHEMTK